MDHPEGAGLDRGDRVDFDHRVRLEFRGAQISSDGGLLVMRELDDALGLSDLATAALRDNRRGKNTVHRLDGLFRQSVFGRLSGRNPHCQPEYSKMKTSEAGTPSRSLSVAPTFANIMGMSFLQDSIRALSSSSHSANEASQLVK